MSSSARHSGAERQWQQHLESASEGIYDDDSATEMLPIRRPHFECRNGALYFLVSKRPYIELDSTDAALWRTLDGTATVGQLRQSFPDADTRLKRYLKAGVCELVSARFPDDRRRIVVVEPHMDDAVLSVGGLMWAMHNECDFTLVTLAGVSNFTSYYYLDREFFGIEQVSALRKAESALVMRMLGGRHVTLGELEAPLRYNAGNWTRTWFRQHRKPVAAFIGHCATEVEVEAWASTIVGMLSSTDAQEIWLPLGVGPHTDHELTRNACLRAVDRLRLGERKIALFLYQDVPYSVRSPNHTADIVNVITAAGGSLLRQDIDIADVFGIKLRLASVYGSQFKLSYMAPQIEEAARLASPLAGGLCERRFKVETPPRAIPALALYSGRSAVEKLATTLGWWYRRHQSARRIRILCPVPVGMWARDITILLEAFPDAMIEVHVSDNAAIETAALVSHRIEVRIVRGPALAWLVRLLQTASNRSCPLILVIGRRREVLARIVRAVCCRSDVLQAATINHFVLALQAVTGNADEK